MQSLTAVSLYSSRIFTKQNYKSLVNRELFVALCLHHPIFTYNKVTNQVLVRFFTRDSDRERGFIKMANEFNTVEEALTTLQNGGFIILSDNEDRENEGDLVALADRINPETVYQMLKEANGLMCVPLTIERAHALGFTKMVENSTDPHDTPFMTTCDGTFEATGVTTGVSAFDRAATIHQIAKPTATASDFNHPGHIQPLYAQDGGLRQRIGHIEASVDLAYLAGAQPVAVIIEVLKEDGTMARRDDLFKVADRLDVPYITINQILTYMDENGIADAKDALVQAAAEA